MFPGSLFQEDRLHFLSPDLRSSFKCSSQPACECVVKNAWGPRWLEMLQNEAVQSTSCPIVNGSVSPQHCIAVDDSMSDCRDTPRRAQRQNRTYLGCRPTSWILDQMPCYINGLENLLSPLWTTRDPIMKDLQGEKHTPAARSGHTARQPPREGSNQTLD
jgi:hypothetical protein